MAELRTWYGDLQSDAGVAVLVEVEMEKSSRKAPLTCRVVPIRLSARLRTENVTYCAGVLIM